MEKDDLVDFARRYYINHNIVFNENEFQSDVKRLHGLKNILSRFLNTNTINERLIVNRMVYILNIFGPRATTIILKGILDDYQFSVAKTILVFLGSYNPEERDDIKLNRIMADILLDTSQRFHIKGHNLINGYSIEDLEYEIQRHDVD